MGVSETFVSIINFGGILTGIVAALYGSVRYFQAYKYAKNIRISTIGWLNLIICVSMVVIILTAYIVPGANNTPFVVHTTVPGVLLIGLFIIFQTIYLFSSRSPMRQSGIRSSYSKQNASEDADNSANSNGSGASENPDASKGTDDFEKLKLLRDLRNKLQGDLFMKYLQIFNMSFPFTTTEMYIPTKVYLEQFQFSIEQEQFAFLDQLNEKLKIREKRIEEAKDLIQILSLKNKKHCILLGEPGIGKTTFLKYLTIGLAGSEEDLPEDLRPLSSHEDATSNLLPLYIELNDYANNPIKNLFDYIVEYYRKRYFSQEEYITLQNIISTRLKDGSLFLLLDGLDEAYIGNHPEKTYTNVCSNISRLAGKYEDTHIIVTSRKASYELRDKLIVTGEKNRGNPFEKLEMAGFLGDDIRKFVRQWIKEQPYRNKEFPAENLYLKLEQDSRLRELSNNPLLLSLITWAYTRELNITHRRAKLYEDCTSALLENWDNSRKIKRTNEALLDIQKEMPGLTNNLLKELAWYFHERKLIYFPEAEVLKFIEEFLKQNWQQIKPDLKVQILDEVIITSGLLQMISEDKKVSADTKASEDVKNAKNYCCFSHITFQEYFAAKYMIDCIQCNKEAETNFLNKWRDPWWEKVIQIYAGLTPTLDTVLDFLMAPYNKDIYRSNILFAGRCIAATSIHSDDDVKKIIEELFAILQETNRKQLMNETAEILVEIDNEDINQKLVHIMGNRNVNLFVRTSIANALGASSDQHMPDILKKLVVNDQAIDNNTLRSSIVYALGKLGDKSVAGDLAEYLYRSSQSGKTADLHISIIDALRSLREPAVVPLLCQCLRSSNIAKNEKIRIAGALGVLGSLIVTQDMKDILSQTLLDVICNQKTSIEVRCACIGTFGRWGYISIVQQLQDFLKELNETKEQNKPAYIRNWPLRSRITVVLNLLGETTVEPDVPSLLLERNTNTMNTEKEESVEPDVSSLLLEQNTNTEKNKRDSALATFIQFLVEQNASSFASKLVPLVFQEHGINSAGRIELAYALGKMGDVEVARQLSQYFVDKDKKELNVFVCSETLLALGRLCKREQLKYEELFPILRTLLTARDTDINIIQSCAEVISELGTLEDRELARKQLLDAAQKVRKQENFQLYIRIQNVILGTLGDGSFSTLVQLVNLLLEEEPDGKGNVAKEERERIFKALIALNRPSIVPYLLDKLQSNTFSLDVRRSIVKVIKHIATDTDTYKVADVCKTLWDVMNKEKLSVLKEDIDEAIWEISRREGLRVYWDTNSLAVQVEKIESLKMEQPTAVGS